MNHDVLRYNEAKRITIIGAIVNILLGIIKVFFGIWGRSHALVADGIHSFSDLITDLLVLFAAKYGSLEADEDHPYGHKRIETAATMALSVLLIIVGLLIIIDSGWRLVNVKTLEKPDFFTLIIAFISVVANEIIFRITLTVAKKIKSELLRANAWHSRSDAASSFIVLIGVAASLLGFTFLDEVAAIAVGGMIVHMGWNIGWNSLRELVDTGVDSKTYQAIHQAINTIPGVLSVHELRTRFMGGEIYVDVHILVEERLSVSEGHYLSDQVRKQLHRNHPEIIDVTVHVDPEDDQTQRLSHNLPSREQAVKTITSHLQMQHIDTNQSLIKLHYLAGKIEVDLFFPLAILQSGYDKTHLLQAIKKALAAYTYFGKLQVYFF